jgi:hypothetical protein
LSDKIREEMKVKSNIMLAMATALLSISGVLAAAVEQWTFDGANPESGINGTIISTWTTSAPNSVPSAGVLRYANTTDSNWGDAQLLPDIDTSTAATMTWTIQLADLHVSAGSNFRFSTLTSAGGDVRPELELTSWGAGPDYTFSPDMEYNGSTDDLGGSDIGLTGSQLGGPLTIVATWNFINNTMTLAVGDNDPVSITPTANMAATIGTITGFRMYPRSIVAGDYLDLDSVTIEVEEWAPTPFEAWLASHGLDYTLPAHADTDGDGVSLLLEYALNLDPHAASQAVPMHQVVGNRMGISYYSEASWVGYHPMMSTNLEDWTTNGVAISPPDASGIATASVPLSTGTVFLRLATDYPVLYVSPSGSGTTFQRDQPGSIDDALAMAPPGTTIRLLPGTYPRIDVGASGEPEQPITLISDSENPDHYAVIDGGNTTGANGNQGMLITDASWLVIENLKFQNCWQNIIELDNCSYVTVRGCDFKEGTDVVHAKAGTHHVLLEYNTWKQREEIWYVWTWADVHHSEVQDLRHYHGSFYDGPWPGSGQNQAYGAVVIRHNQGSHLYNWLAMWSSAPNLQANIEVYGNRVDYVRDNVIEPERYTHNLHVYYNEFNQTAGGVFSLLHNTTTYDDPNMLLNGPMYVYGNVGFLDTNDLVPPEAIGPFDFIPSYAVVKNCKWFTAEPVKFFHNSWKYNKFGFSNDGNNDRQMHHFNNIGVYSNQYGYSFHSKTRFGDWGNVFDYDFSNKAWQSFVTNQGQEANSIVAPEPGWTDPANSDYRLQSGSVCIDAGTVIPGFTQSYDGAAPDIGAYEGDKLVEGPPFYTMVPPGGLGYAEKPRITRHRIAGNQLTLFWSWPLNPATVQDDQIVLTVDGKQAVVTGHSLASSDRELVLTVDRDLEGATLEIVFMTLPTGDNGETATLWGSTL